MLARARALPLVILALAACRVQRVGAGRRCRGRPRAPERSGLHGRRRPELGRRRGRPRRADRLRRRRQPAAPAWSGPRPKSSIWPAGWCCPASRTRTCIRSRAASTWATATSMRADDGGARSPTRIRACAAAHPAAPWVRGARLAASAVSRTATLPEALLDRLVPDRPALLWAADGHSAWVNSGRSRARASPGTRPTPPTAGSSAMQRGEPSGTLRESAADLVGDVLPAITDAERGRRPGRAPSGWPRASASPRCSRRERTRASFARSPTPTGRDAQRAGGRRARRARGRRRHAARAAAGLARPATPRPHVRPTAAKLFQDGVIESRHRGAARPLPRPARRRGHAGAGPGRARPAGGRARPRRLPDPRPRHRRPRHPDDARRPGRARDRQRRRATPATPSPISS